MFNTNQLGNGSSKAVLLRLTVLIVCPVAFFHIVRLQE